MRTPRPWREVAQVFLAAGRGLAAAHAMGMVHRDFKPSNVFIDRKGTPKVGDFGLVGGDGQEIDLESLEALSPTGTSDPAQLRVTRTGTVMGTPAYMAPEQRRGERVDPRADQ